MEISNQFKTNVLAAVAEHRTRFQGSDSKFAKQLGIAPSVYSRLKSGELHNLITDALWVTLGRTYDVTSATRKWQVARTEVYTNIEENLGFCKTHSKSMLLVDDCGIGKTFCARHISRKMSNTFYLDCSQSKTKSSFIRRLAQAIGVSNKGRILDIKEDIKYSLRMLDKPLVILDEAGDLEYTAFLELKEFWNATQGLCGWYLMGADGLRAKIKRGIASERVGFAEILSRFSDEFIKLVPNAPADKKSFIRKLINDVASANASEEIVGKLVNKCLQKEATLRYLETLIQVTTWKD